MTMSGSDGEITGGCAGRISDKGREEEEHGRGLWVISKAGKTSCSRGFEREKTKGNKRKEVSGK